MLKRFASPSMVVALLALVVALSGTSYAALKINGKDIQKGSIPGNRLKVDAVGGRQVNEAKLGPVPHAKDADTLAGHPSTSFLQDPSAFLATGAKAADSDLLDGVDSSGFVKGSGAVAAQSIDTGLSTTVFLGPAIGELVRFRYQCPATIGGTGTLRIINSSTGLANLFVDSGGANPDYYQLGAGGFVEYPSTAGGDSYDVQILGSPGVVQATIASAHRPATNDCHAQALAVLGR